MTKLVAWLFFFGLYTIQTIGHMNSDPAPGRSPGPPLTPAAPAAAPGTVTSSADDRSFGRKDEPAVNKSLTPDHDTSEAIQPLHNNRNRNEEDAKKDTNNTGSTVEINDGLRKSSNIKTNDERSDARSVENKNALNHEVLENEEEKAVPLSLRQGDKSQMHPRGDRVSCRESLSGFASDVEAADELSTSEDREQRPPLDIRLRLQHELFESTSLGGIVCGLMYKVTLQTVLPASSSVVVMPSASPSSHSSSTSSPQHRMNSEIFSNPFYSAEFFVETLSTANGRERGSFVGGSLGNKLPISWLNTLHRNEAGSTASFVWDSHKKLVSPNEEAGSSSAEDGFPSHGDNAAESRQAAQTTVNNTRINNEEEEKGRAWNANAGLSSGNGTTKECPDNKWHGDTQSNADGTAESNTLWMVNELCEQDDEIEFRVFFRTTARNTRKRTDNDGNKGEREKVGPQHVVLKKTFKFKLLKDCELHLRESAASTLDYTSLPLYSTNCTVHFPSYTLSTNASSTASALTPGILVELQRLNVPCRSGSFLRFNDGKFLCGKLEELGADDRMYHFNVLDKTRVQVVRSPMFSLSYKLVDYCYNVSSSNPAGEYYVRSAIHDSLECFFRIHLPHGNRILLRLVTNNDSDVLHSSFGQSTPIYTSLGRSIHTQIINLTLSDSNYVLQWNSRERLNGVAATNHSNPLDSAPVDDVEATAPTSYERPLGFPSESRAPPKLFLGNGRATTTTDCAGIVIKVFENDFAKWSHCVIDALIQRAFILESTSNTLSVHLFRPTLSHRTPFGFGGHRMDANSNGKPAALSLPAVYLAYEALPVPAIVSNCDFGWIAMQQFCVSALGQALTWSAAEQRCVDFGGHLASIRNDLQQQIIDEMLINSPGYQDLHAFWVGGSDKNFEGDFRWSDGLPFQYTNWFPGWSHHGHYNKQPNDDGLSSQDCIELRRYFRAPPGVQTNHNPLARNFMWNDRDCSAKNLFICERPMSDDTLRRSWINDCNKTVSLSKEHPRASIWSPSFPRQYPDNANCFTTVTAPSGYRIVIEFEELVIESEPGCTYDYLEITEPTQADFSKIPKSSKHKNAKINTNNNYSATTDITNKSTNKNLRKRSSYDNPSLSSYTASISTTNYNDNFKANFRNDKTNVYSNSYYNNYNVAQTNYHNLLNVFSTLYKPHTNFIIQTPDYPKGNPYYPTNHARRNDDEMPKRLCGDWSTKLKLLRHVTSGSYLGLHFVSDYSHHFGGYKAKTYMENTASECANERLKPYNGSCYLIVSYPEVDWWTAQQVCRSMGARLSSVSSPDEHRFVTSNIRNQIDYSPQLIYWLGAELERSGHFEWTDDSKMSFQGWLPGQGQFEVLPSDATCLGLQWKMSPTPMLPSGLYWQSQKCNKVGGYVCKKPKESFGRFAFNNSTVSGNEGRLVSPGYPNAYPLNIDYWIHIQAPERTRLVVQFQKIDLEPQDECLYDFVSIENYELVSKITLEPGTNPIPMAMLMSDEQSEGDEFGLSRSHLLQNNKLHNRIERSIAKTRRKPDTGDRVRIHPRTETSSAWRRNSIVIEERIKQIDSKTKWKWREYGNALTLNENPKRRRRKSVSGREFEKKPEAAKGRMHKRRNRRSTIVGRGSFGDDAVFTTLADNAQSFLPYVRWCGSHDSNMSKFDFVSTSNQVVLNFHSDFSITGVGFAAIWKAIDVSGCPVQTLTARQGTIVSPNFPHFLLNSLSCAYIIQAPVGRRVWLEFIEFDMLSDAALEVDMGNGVFRPFRMRQHVNDGIFVSVREQLRVQFRTGQHPRGKGFQAAYHTVGPLERRERVINLNDSITGYLFHLNYPHEMLDNVDFTQNLVAPFGSNILLELQGVEFTENGCPDNNILEIFDNYADNNGTKWQLCKFRNSLIHVGNADNSDDAPSNTDLDPYTNYRMVMNSGVSGRSGRLSLASGSRPQRLENVAPPVYITSYLNTLHIRQRTTSKSGFSLNATVRIQLDNNYKMKLATAEKSVETCQPNPCQFKGKCVTNNGSHYCQCLGHYTGRFCGLNLCELEPCVFGRCELTTTSFKCICQPGYTGSTCEQKQRPCSDNPCEGRGICYEKNGGFFCRCHAWWEGHRCERRMLHIPYKPLSERMLQEPFWLGLITVFVVLAVIGLVWCAKRHFPEKIEKLLAEEADRNRPPGSIHGHHHHTSLREQLQFTTAIPQTTTNATPAAPRSLLNRLGIRKPSLLSLSSPNPLAGVGGAAARTFSLDDLLRPPPRRSPSPRKKRNNSTPVKKNAAEKKQILQQLVSPAAAATPTPKVSLGELISMSENRLRVTTADSESDIKETTFSENSGSLPSCSASRAIIDSKLEKKVTFARLLNKVSAEMSSGSELDIGRKAKRNSSAISLPTDIQFHASSMPPSPCTNDLRSPHSTSSNQGSESLSSSDVALADCGLRSLHPNNSDNSLNRVNIPGIAGGLQRYRFGSATRPKVSSADSILAMFRSLTSTTSSSSNNHAPSFQSNASMIASPSTTPTVASPQEDVAADDESSTSSMQTPLSFTSGPPDSPVFYRQTTIEVPVLDVLNAHKSSSSSTSANHLHPPTILLEIPSSGINSKCLSPIREMPTPIPSPALTPIMPRPQRSNSPIFQEDPLSAGDCSDDDDDDDDRSDRSDGQLSDHILLGLKLDKYRSVDTEVETTPTDTATTSTADMNRHKAIGKLPLIGTTSAPAASHPPQPCITIDVEPPTPDEAHVRRPRNLIIPTLTVEQPSPTKHRHPMIIFPGSPPPQRASIGETSFMFPNKQQQKRLLKQFEKPTSLEFPFAPPTITITSNMSEVESDADSLSPVPKVSAASGALMPPNPVGMCYLSPFTMCSRADRTISESNLSSSGYSSMASPGPSRCGSSNPLCPNEMDEPGSGHSAGGLSLHVNLLNRRRSSALANCKENINNGKGSEASGTSASASSTDQIRQRSDSETFSDDVLIESNDEGIGTDHVDEKLDEARLNGHRLKELPLFMEDQVLVEVDETPQLAPPTAPSSSSQMAQLQLPTIVIQVDGKEKGLSPVSSRSESPLSERAGITRFSPHFYGRKDQLPFTDSDGLYDFPSSDGKGVSSHSYTHQRRSSSKKRERKPSKSANLTQSPTRHQLDVPSKSDSMNTPTSSGSGHVCNKHCHAHHHHCAASQATTRKSPKRRPVSRHPVATSSSSSESLISAKELAVRPLPRRFNSPNREKRPRKVESSLSEDDVADALLRRISPHIVKEDIESSKPKCKINRLRAIGNQIRFLRRLQKSIKTRERLASQSDSCPEENTDDVDSPQATSPLLQLSSPGKSSRIALCRQKRLPGGTYGITTAALSTSWRGMDRSLIGGDDLNSD